MYNKILTFPYLPLYLSLYPQDSYISIYMVPWRGVIFQKTKKKLSQFFFVSLVSVDLPSNTQSMSVCPIPKVSTFVFDFFFSLSLVSELQKDDPSASQLLYRI